MVEHPVKIQCLHGFFLPAANYRLQSIVHNKCIVLQSLHVVQIDDHATVQFQESIIIQKLLEGIQGAIFLDNATNGMDAAQLVLYLHRQDFAYIQAQISMACIHRNQLSRLQQAEPIQGSGQPLLRHRLQQVVVCPCLIA